MTDPTEPEAGRPVPSPPDPPPPGPADPPPSGPLPPGPAEPPPPLGPADSPPPGPAAVPTARPPRRGLRLTALITLIAAGLLGVAGGGTALAREMTRKATKAEVSAALSEEIATRWQRRPAGTIFPSAITYQNAEGNNATATLVGIAPRSACQAALEPTAEQVLRTLGCSTMLRATYAGASGALAATVGIGVLPSASAADKALSDLEPMHRGSGLYALPYSGTIAGTFTNAARASAGIQIAGPYIFLYTAGYTDGMPGSAGSASTEPGALGTGIVGMLEKTLTHQHGNPCSMKDISC